MDTSNPTCARYDHNISPGLESSDVKNTSGNQFDIDDAILNALKGLQVTLAVDSSVKLDDCKCLDCQLFGKLSDSLDATNLAFNQYGVSAIVSLELLLASTLITQLITDGQDVIVSDRCGGWSYYPKPCQRCYASFQPSKYHVCFNHLFNI